MQGDKPLGANSRDQGNDKQGPGRPQGAIHFKEDDVRVKRSRFRIVILSAAQDLCPARDLYEVPTS